ncbi:ribonucleoside-diphosphate reductase, adenosylcobalamin-dependent [Halobacteroides halobius DSM 5150]|uniref:Vitamin B12-dependent ribonucleotide reductase n=1 Tax=Halobacteroides halobius (strain ATCC 35273 / DSM 5150 / MD-1) TaxID=748449 RepID=L0KAK3_HALHC|nr:adenosylcobalamin-dependent ribonucleoside-diphosphate reductase [Halobacteroides halobius]AGB41394.1 ribonucleoside-diphosphate reductase, adenosylcobalamin-dependent [Halobacteroides halobius DSM 5150]
MVSELSENAINLLEKRYLQRDEEGNLQETPPEMFQRVAKNIASAEEKKELKEEYEEKFYNLMTELKFLPNSPTLMNAGAELQQLAACFVLPVEDSMEGIFSAVKNAALIHKSGGGTGFSFSRLRPKNDVVKSTGGVSSGPLSFMKVFNRATDTVKQGGKRRGANMGMLRVDHPDILDFIHAKGELTEENQELYDDYKETIEGTNLSLIKVDKKLDNYKRKLLDNQFSNFNLSVAVTEDFMDAVKEDNEYDLINPRTGEKVDQLPARKVYNLIVNYAWKNGEPGMVFLDEINQDHPLPEEIEATNPCGEQPLLPNEACNLGSINLSKFVANGEVLWDELEETIKLAVRFLDNVVSVNKYPLPEIEEKVLQYRKVGLGVMGFHELIIRLGIAYNSKEAVEMAEQVMKFINDNAHHYSQELAAEKGAFPAFDESEYEIPQRNATLTTIAPTGSISFLGGTSGGIEPFFSFQYSHTDADGNVSYFEYDFTEEAPEEALVTAMDIEPEWHIKVQAAFQQHVDNAVSKTINFSNQATKEDVAEAYKLAHELGCKGLTVYRDGSRTAQVLSTEEEESSTEEVKVNNETILPEERPLAAAGETIMYNTGCGKLYLTINFDGAGNPIETFLTTGSDGGCHVMTEAVSRLTSLALRSGIAPEEIIDQLESTTTCPSFMYEKGKGQKLEGRSCPDVVARALKEIVESKTFRHLSSDLEVIQEIEESKAKVAASDEGDKPLCPECGEEIHFEQGCNSCKNCGYSSCG